MRTRSTRQDDGELRVIFELLDDQAPPEARDELGGAVVFTIDLSLAGARLLGQALVDEANEVEPEGIGGLRGGIAPATAGAGQPGDTLGMTDEQARAILEQSTAVGMRTLEANRPFNPEDLDRGPWEVPEP